MKNKNIDIILEKLQAIKREEINEGPKNGPGIPDRDGSGRGMRLNKNENPNCVRKRIRVKRVDEESVEGSSNTVLSTIPDLEQYLSGLDYKEEKIVNADGTETTKYVIYDRNKGGYSYLECNPDGSFVVVFTDGTIYVFKSVSDAMKKLSEKLF